MLNLDVVRLFDILSQEAKPGPQRELPLRSRGCRSDESKGLPMALLSFEPE